MIWIKIIKSLIGLLHSEISPGEIAAGAALGAIIGLNPAFAIQNILIFFLIFMLKVNIGAAIFSIGIFAIIGFFIDPIANSIGYSLLVNIQGLTPLWTYLYNLPVVPFTRFYNTVVIGNFVISLILFIPLFIFTKKFIINYRTSSLRQRVDNLKIVKLFKLTNIYNIYEKYK